jgi:hypothetical protein
MNKALLGTLVALAVVPASVAMACTSDGKDGIFPANNLYIPAGHSLAFSATQEEFNNAVNKMQKHYAPFFTAQGRTYKIIADWEDGTVNAYANQNGKVSEVHMFGGLARHKKVTADGFMLVICHETGHHLGGAPRKGTSWASNEGQADYFATLKCGREIWGDEDNEAVVAKMEIPQTVTERCQKAFDSAKDIAICKRAAMGGKSLADTLGDLGRTGDTDFDKPDPSVVTEMDDDHPAAQCRLDTYFAGSVCNKSKDTAPDARDPTVGACSQEKGDTLGVRPLCWYLPMTKTPGGPTPPPSRGGSSWPSARVKHHST